MYVLLTVLKMCLFSFLFEYVSLTFEQCHIKKKTSIVMNIEDVLYLVNRNHVSLPAHIRRHRFTEIKYFT